ncbi:tyrosinase-like [Heptranchias perlo]|uniref:tyrosinase-like n=1 Tax=Heptranchias perlo TaxID=212740 RepID=UPI003559891E
MPQMFRLVCSLLLLLGVARAQIPIRCASVTNLRRGECCPAAWQDGSPCGQSSGRGRCQDIMTEGESERAERERERPNVWDFRLWWPSYFFVRMCVCSGNFAGADCGECQPGWRGTACQEKHVVVRRDLAAMSRRERRIFVDRLHQSKTTLSARYVIYASESDRAGSQLVFRQASVYNVAHWMHYLCAKTLGVSSTPFAHRSSGFLGWHKMYLLYLETEIRNMTQDDSFFIPVWTWAGKHDCDVCTDDLFGRSDPNGFLLWPSRFSRWRTYCTNDGPNQLDFGQVCPRGPGQRIRRFNRPDSRFGGLPRLGDVHACLNISQFDTAPYTTLSTSSFRSALEASVP